MFVIIVVAKSGNGKFSVTDSVGRAMTFMSSSCTCLLAINVSCSISVAMFLNRCVISSVSCESSLLVFNTVLSVKMGFLRLGDGVVVVNFAADVVLISSVVDL